MNPDYHVNPQRQKLLYRSGTKKRAGAALALALAGCLLVSGCGRSDAAAANDAQRAQQLLGERRFAEARMAIKAAIAERDDEPQYHILRGRIEYAANAIPQAFDAYSNAMALDPSNMEALQAVSQLGLQTGRLRESLAATEAILSLDPADPNALLMRGLHAIVRNRFDDAIGYADKILARDPANEGGAILKSRALFRKGEPKEALSALDLFSAKKDDTSGISLTRLEIYRALHDSNGMREQFAKLRTLLPDNLTLRIDEANFAYKEGRAGVADALLAALLANPKLSRSDISQIVDLWYEYSPDAPSDAAIGALAASGSEAARVAVAAYLIDKDRLPAAERLIESLPGSDRAPLEAAAALRRGDRAGALARAKAILEKDKTNCRALVVRAGARLAIREFDAALRSSQEAASQCPQLIEAWRLAAISYSERGDLENATRMWRQGIDANRQNSLLAGQFMRWLEANGKQRESVAVARRLTHDAPALMSGWRLYVAACDRAKDRCSAAARQGLLRAGQLYGIDPLPGETAPNGLFGRMITR